MARIVLSTIGTQGDYLAFVALGKELSARGHQVVVAVNEAAHPLFEAAGLEVVSCGAHYGEAQARSHPELFDQWKFEPAKNRRRILKQIFNLELNYRDLLRACRGADLLIAISLQLAAPRVHDYLGIPWIAISLMPGELAHRNRAGSEALPEVIKPQFPRVGLLEPLPSRLLFLEYLRAPLILLASSRHFSQPRLELYPQLKMTGFWFYDGAAQCTWQPSPEVQDFMTSEPRPIALSLGSLPARDASRVVAVHALAAARLGLRLLVQRGWANLNDSALPEEINSKNVLVTGNLPHDWLFTRSSAVAHHGGIGTTARCIRNNCPMLVEPYGRDQFFNAWRITALELGVALHPYKLTAEGLAQALERVFSSDYKRRVAELGELIRAEQGLALACSTIEEFLNGRHQAS